MKYTVYELNKKYIVMAEDKKEMQELARFDDYKEAVKFKQSKMRELWQKLAGSTQKKD